MPPEKSTLWIVSSSPLFYVCMKPKGSYFYFISSHKQTNIDATKKTIAEQGFRFRLVNVIEYLRDAASHLNAQLPENRGSILFFYCPCSKPLGIRYDQRLKRIQKKVKSFES